MATGFLTEPFHLLVGQTAFEPGAGINSGGGMSLPVQMIACPLAVFAAEEMVESHFPSMRSRSVGGDVTANTIEILVRSSDDHHGVPSNDAVKALFHGKIAWIGPLVIGMNGVEVRGIDHVNINAMIFRSLDSSE